MELYAIGKRDNTVRAWHQTKCSKCKDTEKRHNLHGRVSKSHFFNDEEKQRTHDERFNNDARKLIQKHEPPICQSIFFIILREFLKKKMLLTHDLCFFDSPQPLIHGLEIECGIRILDLCGLVNLATKRPQQRIDHPAHDTSYNNRSKGICKNKHSPNNQCSNKLC